MRSLLLLGDDLSGTDEALAAALDGRGEGRVHLHLTSFRACFAHSPATAGSATWEAVDLDARQLPYDRARSSYAAALQHLPRDDRETVVMLKIDSLLRGNVAAALAALPPAADRPVVLAPALPALGRRTVHGEVRLDRDGHEHPHPGSLEGARVDIAAAAGRPTKSVDLDLVRAGGRTLSTLLGDLGREGVVAVCDAETDEDLDAVAAAAAQHPHPVVVGAAGVAAAMGRALRSGDHGGDDASGRTDQHRCDEPVPDSPVLVVVGTAEPDAQPQLARLACSGAVIETVAADHSEPVAERTDSLVRLGSALGAAGCAALRVAPGPVDRARAGPVLDDLAGMAADLLRRHPDAGLVVTGGATARAVLTRLGVETLRPRGLVHPGAAHLRTDDGRDVITRPGSHGGVDSLVQLAHHLGARLGPRSTDPPHPATPPSTEGHR